MSCTVWYRSHKADLNLTTSNDERSIFTQYNGTLFYFEHKNYKKLQTKNRIISTERNLYNTNTHSNDMKSSARLHCVSKSSIFVLAHNLCRVDTHVFCTHWTDTVTSAGVGCAICSIDADDGMTIRAFMFSNFFSFDISPLKSTISRPSLCCT